MEQRGEVRHRSMRPLIDAEVKRDAIALEKREMCFLL
jgi:hypothetical protein